MAAIAVTGLVMVACSGSEIINECPPTDPLCGTNTNNVTAITLTSPTVDTVMAVGMTAQLDAAVTPTNATSTLTWSATPASVATVNTSGVVSAVSAGNMNISASADGVTGMLSMRAVDADLAGITALTTEPFFVALVGELDPATATALNTALTSCATHVASGNLIALDACVLASLNTSSAGGNDDALFGVIDLYLELALDYVGLGS